MKFAKNKTQLQRIKKIIKLIFGDLYSLSRNYYFRIKSKRLFNDYLFVNNEPKLNVGCNINLIQGWLNTDLFYNGGIAYLDASKKFPFRNETFNYIYSEHLFEHLTFTQATNFLMESYRVLKKGGIIRIATPDLDFLINVYKSDDKIISDYTKWAAENSHLEANNEFIENIDVLKVYVINNFFKAWDHQIIHNYSSLSGMLINCGFTDIKTTDIGKSEHSSLTNLEQHGTIIPEEFNKLETIVIEAKRL